MGCFLVGPELVWTLQNTEVQNMILLPSSLAHCFLTLPPQAFVYLLLSFRLLLPESTALQEPCPWDSVVTWNALREATLEQPCYLGGSCLSCQCCKKSLFTWTWTVIMLDWNWWPVSQSNTKYSKNWHWLYWSISDKASLFILRLVGAVIVLLFALCYPFCIFCCRYRQKSQK